jgi:hypothetical protein
LDDLQPLPGVTDLILGNPGIATRLLFTWRLSPGPASPCNATLWPWPSVERWHHPWIDSS